VGTTFLMGVGLSPYDVLDQSTLETCVDRMIRDASRYLPALAKSRYRESLFAVKTVLEKNESDDGRPIFFRASASTPGCIPCLAARWTTSTIG
jgi:hypothetical protein